ncbi:MAG: NADH-quinone oxidoreductase subunit L [Promethearchaeota archaeon]
MLPFAPWLVWIIPIASSIFVPLLGRRSGKARDYFAVIICLITTVFAISIIPDIYFGILTSTEFTIDVLPAIGIQIGVLVDPLSILFTNLIASIGLIVIIYSLGYMAGEENLSRYYFFMLLFIGSMIALVLSDNFFQLFIFWEMVGLCSYSLVSFWNKRIEPVRAGKKVFIMTRVGDVCFFGAILLLYVHLGSFSFSYLISNIALIPFPTLTLVAFLILAGAITKSAQLPLHTWLYTAMEAPTSVSALLHGATMVKAGVYLIARLFILFGPLLPLIPLWLPSVAWIGAITAFIGATLALSTPDIKGVPAYSTTSQIGFMVAALGSATSASSLGWFAGLFHLISHAFFQSLGFLAIGGIIHILGTRDMRQMGGLRKALPITFGLCLVVLFARTGVPPFASFFSKGLIITSLKTTGDVLLVLCVYAAIALTFAYTLRFTILTFLREKTEYAGKFQLHEAPKIMLFACAVLAVFCTIWGFFANGLGQFLGVSVEISLENILSFETVIFLLVLLIGGLPVYLIYYSRNRLVSEFKIKIIAPINSIVERGYFFDDFYEKVIARGILKLSKGTQYVEVNIFERIPNLLASGVTHLSNAVHKSYSILVNRILYFARDRWAPKVSQEQEEDSVSFPQYIVAALIGFLVLLALIMFTLYVM